MAKKKKETTEEVVEKVDNVTKVDLTKTEDDNVVKVDLSKPPKPKEDEIKEEITENVADDNGVVELVEDADTTQEQEEVQSKTETQEPVVEEVKEEEVIEESITNTEPEKMEKELPESIKKLMDFMDDTGGDLEDYIKLNQDYSSLEDSALLKEYYRQTKPHLDPEEIDFLMEDQFSYDEDLDDDREIKRKKLALKEQVAEAKQRLDSEKTKYYEDIKAGSKLTTDQQKAIDFFNRYSKESEENQQVQKKQADVFQQKTNNIFNDKFKGFEYNIGDKRFRYNVKNTGELKETQSDINNFIKKFLNKDNVIEDAKGYHKSIFTAMNSDAIANHFYEQGKVDGLKESIAKSKNIDMEPRKQHESAVNTSGIKFRALGDDSNDFKFKIKQK